MKGQVSSGERRHQVTLTNPGPDVADGDGQFTQSRIPLQPPTVAAKIAPPTARDLERMAAGTVLSTGLRLITMPFHPEVTTKTQATWTDPAGRVHTANVTGVDNPEERCIDTVALAVEVVE